MATNTLPLPGLTHRALPTRHISSTRATDAIAKLRYAQHQADEESRQLIAKLRNDAEAEAKDATQDDYERAMMQLNEKAAGAWEGAVDTIIYAQPEIQTFDHINKDQKGERRKVEITGRTIAVVKPGRGIAAGSRDLVRSPMILSWPEYETQAKRGADLRKAVYAKRAALTTEEQAQLDGRLAAAGFSYEAHEIELNSK